MLGLHTKIKQFFDETSLYSIIKETNLNSYTMESNYEIANLS